MIFDSHAHYDDVAFDFDREELLAALFEQDVCGIVNAASNEESSKFSIELAQRYPHLWAAVGIHPQEVADIKDGYIERLAKLASHPKVVAIGEIGLDFHYDIPRQLQLPVLEAQLQLACQLNLPVIIHDREAHEPILKLLKAYRPKGVVHCFSGSAEMAKEITGLGMYIGLGGAVTFKNAVRPLQVAEQIPLDRLLLETDAPYMAPVPYRGKRCDSSHIRFTAAKIAEIRNIPETEVLSAARQNAYDLFSIHL